MLKVTSYAESTEVAVDAHWQSRLLEGLERLYTPATLDQFPQVVFEVVTSLIPGCPMSFEDIDLSTGAHRASFNFDLEDEVGFRATLAVNLPRDHPAVILRAKGNDVKFCRLSDLLSMRQLKQTGMYSDQFKTMGTKFQFGAFMEMPGHVTAISVNRDVDFNETEEALVRAFTPHLCRAFTNSRIYTALQTASTAIPSFLPETLAGLRITPREAEILQRLLEGKRNDEIAHALRISRRTVEKHCANLFAKLGVDNRAAALVKAQALAQQGMRSLAI